MWTRLSNLVRRWAGWALLVLAAAAFLTWLVTRDTLPPSIRIAAAPRGSLYLVLASGLKPLLHERTGRTVEVLETNGTLENIRHLKDKTAELAILQAGASSMEDLAAIAPLYMEPVHVIVRKGSQIGSLPELAGHRVAVGPSGSGMLEDAGNVLTHFGLDSCDLVETADWRATLTNDESVEAAFVTTGMLNTNLTKLMEGGLFVLLPILDAEALSVEYPYYKRIEIPRGMYGGNSTIPPEPVETIATTAFLAARQDASALLVKESLRALYEDRLLDAKPTIIPADQAREWPTLKLHPAAQSYYDPYKGIGLLANFMESIAAVKELLFALAAGLYLLWVRLVALRKREEKSRLLEQRERLDALLDDTVRIERAQMDTKDPEKLESYLVDVTLTKLKALEELTHEDLRGDTKFSIFLMQCANLIRKIQGKLDQYR